MAVTNAGDMSSYGMRSSQVPVIANGATAPLMVPAHIEKVATTLGV